MEFKFAHTNLNVKNLAASIAFYEAALGLSVDHIIRPDHGNFELCFMTDGTTPYQLELTCLKDHPQPYELGENETHLCFVVDDYAAAHETHAKMGCICFENEAMGLYFIEDPDGYWLEIVPSKR